LDDEYGSIVIRPLPTVAVLTHAVSTKSWRHIVPDSVWTPRDGMADFCRNFRLQVALSMAIQNMLAK